ncbi:MAG: spermidine/putrescine ABC transporter ATP-binding protein PotA [Proteobacteria bacterium]|nr:spermidine/putrescine ABC transporter ATP-binding protein PotA [Pseudomonadota bacterium]
MGMEKNSPIVRLDNVSKCFEDQVVLQDIDLAIQHGEFLTLLGPSGCGKTTLLRLIAGFETPDSGSISINDVKVDHLPPEERQVNTVFQSYALFPHMTVAENVAFGLKMAKVAKSEQERRVTEALRLVHLEGFGARTPDKLSGGQQQRVAIARAIVNRPLVLLLDEPLSALDKSLRVAMRRELKALRRELGITFVFVTHDQEEAFAMSDRVAVMNNGRVEQVGRPQQVYENPVNMFTAKFVGDVNVFDGQAGERENGGLIVTVEGRRCVFETDKQFSLGAPVKVLLRPEDILVERRIPEGDTKTWWPGEIVETVYKGSTWDMIIRLDHGHEVLVTEFFDEDAENMTHAPGEKVMVSWFDGWEVLLPDENHAL